MLGICVVEDEDIIREGLITILEQALGDSAQIFSAENGQRCLDLLMEYPVHVAITDIRMEQMDGLELMSSLREQYPQMKCIVLSGYDDFEYCKRALQNGVVDYLLKPVDENELLGAVRKAIERVSAAGIEGNISQPELKRAGSIQHITDYIKLNYSSEISLDSLAEQFHYNPRYLSQLFKKSTGANFIDYLNNVRVQRAKQFLRQGGSRVEDVAFRVGYKDSRYFARMFKSITGETPSEYRNK